MNNGIINDIFNRVEKGKKDAYLYRETKSKKELVYRGEAFEVIGEGIYIKDPLSQKEYAHRSDASGGTVEQYLLFDLNREHPCGELQFYFVDPEGNEYHSGEGASLYAYFITSHTRTRAVFTVMVNSAYTPKETMASVITFNDQSGEKAIGMCISLFMKLAAKGAEHNGEH